MHREEHKKRLYAVWNKVSERELVKVEGKWYDIYNTKLLSPLPNPTKKFTIDFNKTRRGKTKPAKPTKTTKKTGHPGLALNLYGSLRGKGYTNTKENKEETNSNQSLAPITPEKPQDNGDQITEKADKPQKPTTATTKSQQKNSYKTVANQHFQEANASNEVFDPVHCKQSWRFKIVFDVQEEMNGYNNGEHQEKLLQTTLFQVLTEGQRIDTLFGIRPWKSDKPYPTIYDPRDSFTIMYERLVHYLRAPVQG